MRQVKYKENGMPFEFIVIMAVAVICKFAEILGIDPEAI